MTKKESNEDKVLTTEQKTIAYPALCLRCSSHHTDDGFACTLMVEAMEAGVPVRSCAHFAGVRLK